MKVKIRLRACALIIEKESVLLIEFNDENGLHYNLPAGGVEPEESIIEAVKREAMEEASVEVEVGPLAFVSELIEEDDRHQVSFIFDCILKKGSIPKLPPHPDPDQTGVKWVPLSELNQVVLYPNIRSHIIEYAKNKRNIELIEECHLETYE